MWIAGSVDIVDDDSAEQEGMDEGRNGTVGSVYHTIPPFTLPLAFPSPQFLQGAGVQPTAALFSHPPSSQPMPFLVSQSQEIRPVVSPRSTDNQYTQSSNTNGTAGNGGAHICPRSSVRCGVCGSVPDQSMMTNLNAGSESPPPEGNQGYFMPAENRDYYGVVPCDVYAGTRRMIFDSPDGASSARPIRLVENPSYCPGQRSARPPPAVHRQKRPAAKREASVELGSSSGSSDDELQPSRRDGVASEDQDAPAEDSDGIVEAFDQEELTVRHQRRKTKAVKIAKMEAQDSRNQLEAVESQTPSTSGVQNLIDLTGTSESEEDDVQVIGGRRKPVEVEEEDGEFIDPINPVADDSGSRAEVVVAPERIPGSSTDNNLTFSFEDTQQLHREPIASPRSFVDGVSVCQTPSVHHHCCTGSPAPPPPTCPHSTCTCHHRAAAFPAPHAPCGTCYAATAHHYHHFHHHHHHHSGSGTRNVCQLHSPCPTHCPYGSSHPTVTPAPIASTTSDRRSMMSVRSEQPQERRTETGSSVLVSGHQEEGVPPRQGRTLLGGLTENRPSLGAVGDHRPSQPYNANAPYSPGAVGDRRSSQSNRPGSSRMSAYHRNLLDRQNAQAERGRQALNPWFERQRQRTRHAAGPGGSAFYSQPTAYEYGYYGMLPVTGGWPDTRGGILPAVPPSTQQQFHPNPGLPISVLANPHVAAYHRPDSPAFNPVFRVPTSTPRQVRRPGGPSPATSGPATMMQGAPAVEAVRPAGYLLVSPSGPAVAAPAAQVVQAAAAAATAAVAHAAQVVPMVRPQPVIPPPMPDFGTLAVGPFYFGAGDMGVVGGPTFTVAGAPEPQPVGASQQVIEQCTETLAWRPNAQVPEGEEERCTVCLSEFEAEERVRTLRCAHIFHSECIDRWLILNKKCPICRVEVDRGCQVAAPQRAVAQSPEVMITFEATGRPFHTRTMPATRMGPQLGVQAFNPMSFGGMGLDVDWTEQ